MSNDNLDHIETLKQLADPDAPYAKDISLYSGLDEEDIPLGVRVSLDTSLESVDLTLSPFEEENGDIKWELAVGMEFEIRKGEVAVIDLLKMAMRHCPELVARAMRETGTADVMRQLADTVALESSNNKD